MQTLNQRSDVDFSAALDRSILRYRSIRFCFSEFAALASRASRTRRTFAGGVSADAFVSRALCDERNSGRCSGHSDAISVFASAEKRHAACVAICLARIGAWRSNAGEGDRDFVAASRNCVQSRGKLAYARAPIAISLRNLGLLLAICLAVCGWHYARIWLRFGTPLLGNWDVISGFTWWQDPGYHTAADYVRFGRSLMHPFFSGFAGFADGIYSTLWGDGLCGGSASLSVAWNEQPLLAGYLWSLIPTALVLIGAVVAIVRFIRKPSSELFLLLGFSAVIVLGLIFMTLKVPSYAQAKAFYGLSALAPLCFFGALGWETLTRRNECVRFVLGMLILAWAMNSFATYWIVPSVSQHLYAAKALGTQGNIDRANAEAVKAVEADPSNATARGFHALSLSELGQDEGAIQEGERAVELNPAGSAAHLDLAISVKRSDQERAITEARHAIQLGPENSSAYQFLMNCLFESHLYSEAADLGREWLAVTPYDAAAHSELGSALAQNGDLVSAAQHLGYLMLLRPDVEEAHAKLRQLLLLSAKEPDGLQRLRHVAANAPDSPRMLDELAWLLATNPDSQVARWDRGSSLG